MRMLKCYLANDSDGRFVTANEISGLDKRIRTCVSCHGLLVWHAGAEGEAACFEHDQQAVYQSTLMNCTYLDPQVKTDARHEELRRTVGRLSGEQEPALYVVKSALNAAFTPDCGLITPLAFRVMGETQRFVEALATSDLLAHVSGDTVMLMPVGVRNL